jgi:SAM-dependent methyltransferase
MAQSSGSVWTRLFSGKAQEAEPAFPHERPLPVPPGVDLESIEAVFRSYSVNGEPEGHLDAYVQDSFWRFLHTWGLVRDKRGACLEIGANPYFTTLLLDEYTDLELTLTNYYGESPSETTTETLCYRHPKGEAVEKTFTSHLLNVEQEPFPFEEDAFDVVLFCEVIEHLLMDPLAALREINRVLCTDGQLILTTPNVNRLENVLNMISGANVYDPYSGYGPYGRHNREYNRHEVTRLLEFAGFDVDSSFTADAHPSTVRLHPHYEEVLPLIRSRPHDLGHYIFISARSARPPREGLPAFLYRSWPPEVIVNFA